MEEFLTIDEVATTLRMSRWSVGRFITSGQLTAIKSEGRNGAVRIPRSAFDAFLAARTVTAQEER